MQAAIEAESKGKEREAVLVASLQTDFSAALGAIQVFFFFITLEPRVE